MTPPATPVTVRPTTARDAAALCDILNDIIARGGTTAFETPFMPSAFQAEFIDRPKVLVSLIAEAADGAALGFQVLQRNPALPEGWGDIATFTRREPRTPGVGAALFARTQLAGRALGLAAINATIRADNASGLPFYDRMGFVAYDLLKAVPLADGTPVDRVRKRFSLR